MKVIDPKDQQEKMSRIGQLCDELSMILGPGMSVTYQADPENGKGVGRMLLVMRPIMGCALRSTIPAGGADGGSSGLTIPGGG